MNLSMTGALAVAYQSGAQRARVVTEAWGEKNLFCPNCSSPKLTWLEPGHPASDYSCPACGFWYQLKSQKSRIGDSITDGAYAAMMNAIRHDELPSFYFMQYEISGRDAALRRPVLADDYQRTSQRDVPTNEIWTVRNLLLVPSFAFPPSAIIKRKPLAATARRHGWVGCNFALNRIPVEARIPLVTESRISPAAKVREKFKRVKPLREIGVKERGWTLDVLNAVRRLCEVGTAGSAVRAPSGRNVPAALPPVTPQRGVPTNTFTTSDAYAFTRELEKLHPDNRHVRDKIRQQLQVLRDMGLLLHVERGFWRLP